MTIRLEGLEESILPLVSKPGRYLPLKGQKPPRSFERARVRLAVVVPAPLESAWADPRLHTLLDSVREAMAPFEDEAALDLAFAPDHDLAALLAEHRIPWFGLVTRRPLVEFDALLVPVETPAAIPRGEALLELARIPSRSANRSSEDPLVVAGGLAASDPAAALLADVILRGDPEAFAPDLVRVLARSREPSWNRRSALFRLAELDGVLVNGEPGLGAAPGEDTAPRCLTELPRLALGAWLPAVETEATGLVVEIARPWGNDDPTRPYAPLRVRPADDLLRDLEGALAASGEGEVVLAGRGVGRHPELPSILEALSLRLSPHGVQVRLAEADLGAFTPPMARELQKGRRVELAFAPVLPSERLRDAAGRPLGAEAMSRALDTALRGTWAGIRLRVVLGSPGETEADRDAWGTWIEGLMARPRDTSKPPRLVVEVLPYRETPGQEDEEAPGASSSPRLTAEAWRKRWRRGKVRVEIGPPVTPAPGATTDDVTTFLPVAPPRREEERDGGSPEAPGFGIPSWHEGRRPRRASRTRELQRSERYRLRFAKDERLRFISHLDVARAFLRAFRQCQLPLALSNGKDRRPKVAFGPPLPLGMTSGAEVVDVAFAQEVPESFARSLNQALPEGLVVIGYAPIRNEPASLQSAIQLAGYEVSFPDVLIPDPANGDGFDAFLERLDAKVREALASDRLDVVKTRGETSQSMNVRPSLHRAEAVRDDGGRPALSLTLSLNRPDSVRPERLTAALIDWTPVDERLLRVHRSGLIIPGRNKDLDPLDVVESGFEWWRQPVRGGTVL
jgi:radical SAM-linked protein